MIERLHAFISEINDLYWFGYTVGWIAILTRLAGGYKAVWLGLYIFGALICLVNILSCYRRDYF